MNESKPRHISPLYHPELHDKGFVAWLKECHLAPQDYQEIPELYWAYGNYRCDMEERGIIPNIGVTSNGKLEGKKEK